ncbi:N-acetylmuramoyl-L-alanine amidase [Cellulosimicrobium arenosum]|uniref:N-acetylmuramoyl-L-alanine amidase n=1 Tax=Cellulosimicrobium arenosum TaxID=2708133 RepID=A0A927J1N7_9MICO|nr:N-acetylmuramoyl-L-alanine amidase [Cellulosimicrobium arenosum]
MSPDVDEVELDGVDADAKRERGALDEAVGHAHAELGNQGGGAAQDEVEGAVKAEALDLGTGTVADSGTGDADGALAALSERTTTQDFLVAGVTWDASSGEEVTDVAVRLRESGSWSEWQSLGVDDNDVPGGRAGTEPLVTTGADGVQARVRTVSGKVPSGLQVDVVDPGTSRADAYVGEDQAPASSANAATGFEIRPKIVSRAGWGADESLASNWPETSKSLHAIYVHHTAGTNSYKESQSAALVRGIYAYHTKSRDWPDIGYQYLVDKFGNVFEGRTSSRWDNPIGAQAGGYNTGTVGVSAMGNYDTARPTSSLITALQKVVAWKSYQYGFTATGATTLVTGGSSGSGTRARPGTKVKVLRVLMHRTTNETACPGRYLAAKMSDIRSGAEARRKAAVKKYGAATWAVGKPATVKPLATQQPVQWYGTTTYRWKKVSGARTYQVLQRYAQWDSTMPSTNYWRVVGATTGTSMTVSQSEGLAKQLAVRAIGQNWERGPLTTLVKTSTPIQPSDWVKSSGWTKVTGTPYWGDYAYKTTKSGAVLKLRGTEQVKRVVIRGGTAPGGGRLKVAVGSTTYRTLDFDQATDSDKIFTVTLPRAARGTVTLKAVDSGKPVRISQIALARW